jgi:hypothetical protein
MDYHPRLPVRIDRRLPQPAVRGGVTAIEVRPVMPVEIDALDPDGIHNHADFQPACGRD